MKWEEILKNSLVIPRGKQYEEIYRICMSAYMEGRIIQKNIAMEAYRLRCYRLFGNRCMDFHLLRKSGNCICEGNCLYIKKFESELYKLDN